MEESHKKIDFALNVAIILVSLLTLGSLIKSNYFTRLSANPHQPHSPVGKKVQLEGVDWSKSERTLLMAIKTDCIFCKKSAPFYQRLGQQAAKQGNVRLIAVSTESIEEVQKFLSESNITVNEIKQAKFDLLGVKGTPTLILADSSGIAMNGWVGLLSSAQEIEVLTKLGLTSGDN